MQKIKIRDLYYTSIQNPSLLDIISFKCYNSAKKLFNKIGFIIDKIRYKKIFDKLVSSNNLNNIEIASAVPYKCKLINHIHSVHKTQPFQIYELKLESGEILSAADNHLVFCKNLISNKHEWTYIRNLHPSIHLVFNSFGQPCKIDYIEKKHQKEFMYDVSVIESNKSYCGNGVLNHNTTTTSAYMAWVLCFHNDKNAFIVANKRSTAVEILGKMKEVIEGLPFFLKPGIVNMRSDRIKFENGCSLRCAATSKTPATGDSIQYLYIDECAVIPPNIIEEFWASVEPTMSAFRGSQIIMSSTPRGKGNLFHRIYEGALNGTNDFIATRVDWWEVPGRDAKWEKAQRLKLGDELFNREFGLSFESSTSRLISAYYLNLTNRIKKTFITRELYRVPKNISEKIYWHPDFDPGDLTYYDLLRRHFLFIVDTAEGIEKGTAGKKDSDYNVINIFELDTLSPSRIDRNRNFQNAITIGDVMRYKQIGIYIDNNKDEEESAEAAKQLAFQVFKTGFKEIDSVRILIEMNFNGKNWVNKFKAHPGYYDPVLIKCPRGTQTGIHQKLDYGFKTVSGSRGKNYYCELGSKMMDNSQIIIQQHHHNQNMSSLAELQQFGKNSKGKYEGSCIHDDIAVTCFWVSIANEQELFQQWCEEWLEAQIPTKKIQTIQWMLNTYVETEPEVTDEEFSKFFSAATNNMGMLTKQQQNTYGSLMQQRHNQNNRNGFNGMNVYKLPPGRGISKNFRR